LQVNVRFAPICEAWFVILAGCGQFAWSYCTCVFHLCFSSGWWFGTFGLCSIIWDVILAIDFHIFQDGFLTTNQVHVFFMVDPKIGFLMW
jgi:hypothetical protein